eukprot:583424-Pelagomonas_calceolata.AAC.2
MGVINTSNHQRQRAMGMHFGGSRRSRTCLRRHRKWVSAPGAIIQTTLQRHTSPHTRPGVQVQAPHCISKYLSKNPQEDCNHLAGQLQVQNSAIAQCITRKNADEFVPSAGVPRAEEAWPGEALQLCQLPNTRMYCTSLAAAASNHQQLAAFVRSSSLQACQVSGQVRAGWSCPCVLPTTLPAYRSQPFLPITLNSSCLSL